MSDSRDLTEQESLALISNMIQKVKASHHDTGITSLMWGTVVTLASLVTYLQREFEFKIGFDIWLIVFAAIIPQVIITLRKRRQIKVVKYEDAALDAVWLAFGLSIFGLTVYQNIVPYATVTLSHEEGWQMVKHYTDGSGKPDEILRPFPLSIYSIYILLYAVPTLVTGITKKFRYMILGAILSYVAFVISCYTASKYDMLLGAIAAAFCWLIPGIIIRRKYLAQRKADV
ncbi:hypothetical protein [Sediminibacterium ginsengisoli]|uniref:Uncharacterized protein n=1 Tax=Sediminibacterium ginsengisoli TaxID=413434 RepID=A0A1T4JXA3_9BACT|nr:hypothetical protein [Sediminibacterium ginsengisoli]SJZ34836.1 hypothetical protein SAMN04488132_101283 [Sediminibacterium ginsengisoli]